MRFGSAIVAAAAAPVILATSQPLRLQPSSPWVLDYAENSCRLIRTFGKGNDKTVLAFESEAPGQIDLLAAGERLGGTIEEVPAKFLPVKAKPFKGRTAISVPGGRPAILWSGVRFLPDALADKAEKKATARKAALGVRPPPIDLAEQAAERSARQEFSSNTTELEIDARWDRAVVLETGSLGEPVKAFDKCSRDSLRDWGVDPDVEDKIVRPVWPLNSNEWFNGDDYPRIMLALGEESEVKVRLLVDSSGRVTKCTSLIHFKEPEFNRVVCANLTKRAKFAPAELADGTKVPSYYANRVNFRIAR